MALQRKGVPHGQLLTALNRKLEAYLDRDHAKTYQGKPWKYLLIPHDAIAENMTLTGLAAQFVSS